ncbi:MAG: ABC transporter permease [Candidatus Riflebacteria bacterium]|nr:ABC transporter permease [Candidatus Riflebacteria bacterium]
MTPFAAIILVWRRYLAVYQKNLVFGITTTFVEPILFLVSFGVGVGSMIGEIDTGGLHLSYRQFVFAGIAAQTILFQGFFEAAYGSFVRMYYQRIFQAMAMTPITLSEILWGELLWDATKASTAACAVFLIGVLTGDFRIAGVFLYVLVAFCASLLFAALGLLSAAKARSIEDISYPQYLLVFPMFLFCGVFFPLATLSPIVRSVAWVFPLTPVIDVVRAVTLGMPMHIFSPVLILCWIFFLVPLSRRAMMSRLVK